MKVNISTYCLHSSVHIFSGNMFNIGGLKFRMIYLLVGDIKTVHSVYVYINTLQVYKHHTLRSFKLYSAVHTHIMLYICT